MPNIGVGVTFPPFRQGMSKTPPHPVFWLPPAPQPPLPGGAEGAPSGGDGRVQREQSNHGSPLAVQHPLGPFQLRPRDWRLWASPGCWLLRQEWSKAGRPLGCPIALRTAQRTAFKLHQRLVRIPRLRLPKVLESARPSVWQWGRGLHLAAIESLLCCLERLVLAGLCGAIG